MSIARRTATALTSAVILSSGMAAATAVATAGAAHGAGPVQARCGVDHVFVKSTERGFAVWVPTDNHFSTQQNPDGWQQGGTQGWTRADGKQRSRTKGSSDSASGGGGFSVGVASVSGEYNHEWNRSTSTGSSVLETVTQTVNLPKQTSRVRIYHSGWKFNYKVTVVYQGGPQCTSKTFTRTSILPDKKPQTAELVELYTQRGQAKRI